MLTRAIFVEGCKSVAAGMNAMDLRRGINLAVDSVVSHLKSQAKMISTSEEIAQVSTLSLNSPFQGDAYFDLRFLYCGIQDNWTISSFVWAWWRAAHCDCLIKSLHTILRFSARLELSLQMEMVKLAICSLAPWRRLARKVSSLCR